MKFSYLIFIAILILFSQCRPKQKETPGIIEFTGKPLTPSSILEEHSNLLKEIRRFALLDDSTGRAALRLEGLMIYHFREEEDYILPPLGLLPELSKGNITVQKDSIIQLTEKFKSRSDLMLAEHQMIIASLQEMKQAAERENHPGVEQLEKALTSHALVEEQILFPTAILVGEYLKLKSKSNQN